MASETTNLKLTKPATTDNVDIRIINTNMDIIDEAIGNMGTKTKVLSCEYKQITHSIDITITQS